MSLTLLTAFCISLITSVRKASTAVVLLVERRPGGHCGDDRGCHVINVENGLHSCTLSTCFGQGTF